MISFAIVIFLGLLFYKLSEKNNGQKWPITVIGMASYYGGSIFFSMITAVVNLVFTSKLSPTIEASEFFQLGSILFGFSFSISVYIYFMFSFKKQKEDNSLNMVRAFGKSK